MLPPASRAFRPGPTGRVALQRAPTDKLDTEGAATYCGIGKSTLEKLRLTGGGPTYMKPTRSLVYQVSDLDAWLDRARRRSTSEVQSMGAAA